MSDLTIPVFITPKRMYGPVAVEHLPEDSEDVVALWDEGCPNVIEFPDEGRSMVAPRTISHRRWAAAKQTSDERRAIREQKGRTAAPSGVAVRPSPINAPQCVARRADAGG